ncbi:MAG: PDZ domain-containing protein, partial [Bryobacteraceae bacterium]
ESARSLDVLRKHRKLTVKMPSLADAQRTRVADESLGIRILPAAVAESLYVAPGTPAYSAGLRTEDHLVQINERRSSAVAELSRAIAAMGDKPLLLVYQRGRVQRAALVTK